MFLRSGSVSYGGDLAWLEEEHKKHDLQNTWSVHGKEGAEKMEMIGTSSNLMGQECRLPPLPRMLTTASYNFCMYRFMDYSRHS